MAEALSGINGQMLRWARNYLNMSETDAAQAIGVPQEEYTKWEAGEAFPTYAKLKKISNALKRPSALFFFSDPPVIGTDKLNLRTLSSVVINRLNKQVIQQFDKAKVYQLNLQELYGDRTSILLTHPVEKIPLGDLCLSLRQQIGLSVDAQKNCKDASVAFEIFRRGLYDCGIYVFKDSFKDETVSGLCVYDPGYPVIMINNAMSFARQVFTLFHELYHLLLNCSGVEIIRDDYYTSLSKQQARQEKACDQFANEFLVPSMDFRDELANQPISESLIQNLSSLYCVSKEAIMYKLLQMHRISSADYSSLKETFYGDALRNGSVMQNGSKKNGGNYYATKLAYLGAGYTGEILSQYQSNRINAYQASEMLGAKVDHHPKIEFAFYRGIKR